MKNTFPLFSVHNQQEEEEEEHHQDQQEQRQQQQEHKRQVGTRLEALFKYLFPQKSSPKYSNFR